MKVILGGNRKVLVNQTGVNLQRLSDLNDVDTSNVQEGYLMVYDDTTKTYVFTNDLDNLNVTNLDVDNLIVKDLTADGNINISGNINITGNVTFDTFTAANGTITDTLTVNDVVVQGVLNSDNITAQQVSVLGDLQVIGQLTSLSSEELEIADNIILLNSNISNSTAPTQNAGISIKRGTESNVELIWKETTDVWSVGTKSFEAQTFIGDLQGNADTATSLSSSIQIDLTNDVTGNTSFDGSGNITIQTTVEFVDGGYY